MLKKRNFLFCHMALFLFLFMIVFCFLGITVKSLPVDDYAPIFYFEGEETCYPVDTSYLLSPENYEEKTAFIEGMTVTYYDNTHGSIDDNGVVNDYKSKESSLGYTVYYYENTADNFIQYWMFYAFNPGDHNRHEGDWEMVQVVLPSSGNKWVAYSQHYSGQRATWSQVEKDGTHMKVYVARGSHANYLRSYSGKVGVSSDIVGANGKVLKPGDYQLIDITTQSWLDENVLWGELYSTDTLTLGSDGPQGPKYRIDMYGNTMWNGLTWGASLPQASDLMFLLEFFVYHFITIFVLITLVLLAIILVRIYYRHKKYGLGPRILSMLYIDGFNLNTIGNILCIIGIILAIIGVFGQWYFVSADIQSDYLQTQGMTELISIHGLEGVQIYMPGPTGFAPIGSAVIPFAVIILVGLVLMIISTIGIFKSRKLGMKYLFRGIRFIIFVSVLIIAIMAMGSLVGNMTSSDSDSSAFITNMLKSISNQPFGGQYSAPIIQEGLTAQVSMKWGIGTGAIILLTSGIILLVAGVIEIVANKQFFEPKIPVSKKISKHQPPSPPQQPIQQKQQPPAAQTPPQKPSGGTKFCTECGAKLKENTSFCTRCGKKIK